MMDGSLKEDGKTIADYDYNVEVTKKVVDIAHKLGRDGRRAGYRLPGLFGNHAGRQGRRPRR